MGRKKKRKSSKKSHSGPKLQSNTIYLLCTIGLLCSGAFLFASFFMPDPIFVQAKTMLSQYFGVFSPLIPLNLIFMAFLFLRVKTPFTSPNVPVGFAAATVALLGLFKSGTAGQSIYTNGVSLFGGALTVLILAVALFIGLIVLFNVSIPQLGSALMTILKGVGSFFTNHFFPLFRSRPKSIEPADVQQPVIRGLGKEPSPMMPAPVQMPVQKAANLPPD
jgi:hypothetical protein